MEDKIVDFIEKSLNSGWKTEEIEQELKNAGHSKESIEKAFLIVRHRKILLMGTISTIIMAILLVTIQLFIPLEIQEEPEIIKPAETKFVTILTEDERTLENALFSGNISMCYLIEDEPTRLHCIRLFDVPKETKLTIDESILESAIEQGSEQDCMYIEDEAARQFCLNQLNQEIIELGTDEVLLEEALESGNLTLCYQIGKESTRNFCLNMFT